MKVLGRHLARDKSGYLKVECEEGEDFWHIYNILRVGDTVTAPTIRKVSYEGSSKKERFRATIRADAIDYDTGAQLIRVKGVNLRECKYMALGQSHTIELALHRAFKIEKTHWDSVDLERIRTATDPSKTADCVVVAMDSNGLCNVILVSGHSTTVRSKISKSIPRKRVGSTTRHDKAVERFFQLILNAILKHVNFEVVKVIVVASPGFVKDTFLEYMWREAGRGDDKYKILFANKAKFLASHVSGAHKGAVKEILQSDEMKRVLSDTKASADVALLDEFYKLLNRDESRAIYGFEYVRKANAKGAIRTLVVSDALFRSTDIATRKQYIALVESAKRNGAEIRVFSSLHTSGEQLEMLTGVAAILKFSMPELLEIESEEDSDEDSDSEDVVEEGSVHGTDDDYEALLGDSRVPLRSAAEHSSDDSEEALRLQMDDLGICEESKTEETRQPKGSGKKPKRKRRKKR